MTLDTTGVSRIKAKTYIIGVDRDTLIPPDEQQNLYLLLKALGHDVKYEILSSLYGHDAFLKDFDWFGDRVSKFLKEEVEVREKFKTHERARVSPMKSRVFLAEPVL